MGCAFSEMKRIHLISGPRNISTALMYSFAQRPDTRVVDEPFYAHYLSTHPEVDHPGRAVTLKAQSTNWQAVVDEVVLGPYDTPIVFLKGMAHHLVKMDTQWLQQVTNLFLIRNPAHLIASFAQVIPNPIMRDIGLRQSYDLFKQLVEKGIAPIVLDSGRLLANPPGTMQALCKALKIPYHAEMLSWSAGPRQEDGPWAPYWYANVHGSTGFSPQRKKARVVPEHLRALLAEAQTYYDQLSQYAI